MGESIEVQLVRIETKLDAILEDRALEPERRKRVYDRLEALERWQTRMIAAGSVIVVIFGLAYKVLIDLK